MVSLIAVILQPNLIACPQHYSSQVHNRNRYHDFLIIIKAQRALPDSDIQQLRIEYVSDQQQAACRPAEKSFLVGAPQIYCTRHDMPRKEYFMTLIAVPGTPES